MATTKYSKIAAKAKDKAANAEQAAFNARMNAVLDILHDTDTSDYMAICTAALGMLVSGHCEDCRDNMLTDIRDMIESAADDTDEICASADAQDEREATGATTH